uniref:PEP-CTERM sorting domain-containing protein n=1 Tax=Leptospirillum ferriphilum TaxID=178606 RepID=A0A7C3QW58_9BACT
MSRFRKFSVHGGLFVFLIISTLFIRLSNANATMLDLTGWEFQASTTNAIAPDGGAGPPFNGSEALPTTVYASNKGNPSTSDTNTENYSYSTSQGKITSDITTQGNLSNTGVLTFNHAVSITNTFPSSLDYGVYAESGINFSGVFTGNGSEITLPVSFKSLFSNTGSVQGGSSFLQVSVSGPSGSLTTYSKNGFGTGSGLLTDLTFQTVAGDAYLITYSDDLSGYVTGNASADLTFTIGASLSQTPVSATPEPSTLWLMATGILGMFGWTGSRRIKVQD